MEYKLDCSHYLCSNMDLRGNDRLVQLSVMNINLFTFSIICATILVAGPVCAAEGSIAAICATIRSRASIKTTVGIFGVIQTAIGSCQKYKPNRQNTYLNKRNNYHFLLMGTVRIKETYFHYYFKYEKFSNSQGL